MPAMTFVGDPDPTGRQWPLFRVYAFTDRGLRERGLPGSVVGGPAFAPRSSGPLKLPTNQDELDLATRRHAPEREASEGAKTFMAPTARTVIDERDDGRPRRRSRPRRRPARRRHADHALLLDGRARRDRRRRQTDVRVRTTLELPQDACEAGRVPDFGKQSRPAITGRGHAVRLGPVRRRAACSQAPGRRPSSTRPRSSPGSPSSARPATRSSGRDRSTRGARAGHAHDLATSSVLQLSPASGTTASAD